MQWARHVLWVAAALAFALVCTCGTAAAADEGECGTAAWREALCEPTASPLRRGVATRYATCMPADYTAADTTAPLRRELERMLLPVVTGPSEEDGMSATTTGLPRLVRDAAPWEAVNQSAGPEALFTAYAALRRLLMVPTAAYKAAFRATALHVMGVYREHFADELAAATLRLRFVNDTAHAAEAWCAGDGFGKDGVTWRSTVTVNLARAVAVDKLQQLAAHEVMHHVQYAVRAFHMRRAAQHRSGSDDGVHGSVAAAAAWSAAARCAEVQSLLLEGGAELAWRLVFPDAARAAHLADELLPLLATDGAAVVPADATDAALRELATWVVAVDRLKQELSWREVVLAAAPLVVATETSPPDAAAARLFDATVQRLEERALVANDSWPTAAFLKAHGPWYVVTYAWGYELQRRHVRDRCVGAGECSGAAERCSSTVVATDAALPCLWERFAELTRRPRLPYALQRDGR